MAFNARSTNASVRVASASIDHEIRNTHPTTLEILHRRHVSLGRTKSRALTPELVDGSDLVLVMTAEHARAVVGRFPKARHKVFVLEHFAAEVQPAGDSDSVDSWLSEAHKIPRDYSRDDGWDIQDPNGQSDAIYSAVEVQIDNATMWLATVISTLPDD